jgi:hypothetical protein
LIAVGEAPSVEGRFLVAGVALGVLVIVVLLRIVDVSAIVVIVGDVVAILILARLRAQQAESRATSTTKAWVTMTPDSRFFSLFSRSFLFPIVLDTAQPAATTAAMLRRAVRLVAVDQVHLHS